MYYKHTHKQIKHAYDVLAPDCYALCEVKTSILVARKWVGIFYQNLTNANINRANIKRQMVDYVATNYSIE